MSTRTPKESKKPLPTSLAKRVLALDRMMKGGDALSDVLLPFDEWIALVEQAQAEVGE